MWQLTLSFLVCQILAALATPTSMNDEARLIRHLLTNYKRSGSKFARPVMDPSDALEVRHGLSLQKLDKVDVRGDRIVVTLWENYGWKDETLTWSPAEFGGISSVRLPSDKIYIPDIELFNSERKPLKLFDSNVVVSSDGSIIWVPPEVFTPMCQIPKRVRTGDEVDCALKFGSWTYDGSKIDLQLQSDKGDTSTYVTNDDWTLIDVPAERHVVKYECCPEQYIDVTYTIKLRKN